MLKDMRSSQAASFVTSTILGPADQFTPQKVARPRIAQSRVTNAGNLEEYSAHVRCLKAKVLSRLAVVGQCNDDAKFLIFFNPFFAKTRRFAGHH